MAIRRILEKIIYINGSSGYGFPFSPRHLNFYNVCSDVMEDKKSLQEKMKEEESIGLISKIA